MWSVPTKPNTIDSICVKSVLLSKEHTSSPWRWCEIHRSMWEKQGIDMYWIKSVHLVGATKETSNEIKAVSVQYRIKDITMLFWQIVRMRSIIIRHVLLRDVGRSVYHFLQYIYIVQRDTQCSCTDQVFISTQVSALHVSDRNGPSSEASL